MKYMINFLDLFGLFIFLAGFVVGLGAVTVIDIHGFLGRKSAYWTEATIRTHKVTKPLIWTGIILATIGGFIFYRNEVLVGAPLWHLMFAGVLVLNGLFLSFVVSPFLLRQEREGRSSELLPGSLQLKITLSFIISFVGWWSALLILAWYVIKN